MEYSFTSGKVKLLGRAFEYNNTIGLSFSASGIEFVCEDGFTAVIMGDDMTEATDAETHYARYAVFADGERICDRRLENRKDVINAVKPGRHVFRLIKLSESVDSTMFVCDIIPLIGGKMEATPEKKMKIEFIGDSITCGYGVDGCFAEGETYTTATEDASKAYAYLTAELLDWDYSLVSKSGAGIISGYNGEGRRNLQNLLPPYYEYAGCSMLPFERGEKPEQIRWDFKFKPDVIVINLGTNDKSYCRPDCGISETNIEEEDLADIGAADTEKITEAMTEKVYERRGRLFRDKYMDFIRQVRACNPDSRIICSLGIMEDAINCEVKAAVETYSVAAADENIEWYEFEKHDMVRDGIGTDYHPSAKTHADRAEKLYKHIHKAYGLGRFCS